MREDFQRKRQMQQPVRGQSSQPPAKRPFQGPSKGPSLQQQRPQGASAPRPVDFSVCKECSKRHPGPCMLGTGRCFHCKETEHVSRDCPKRRQATGRVFVMQAEAADPETTLLTEKLLVLSKLSSFSSELEETSSRDHLHVAIFISGK
ncbi:hypothetical protein F511_35773 [Dorcoceras hygrometricum]|uniref:CCHC-type domain-containing protein n=1 Tax=Dorcoceras hygrometricum TaxID=472368 RepID=A0A2Z7BVH8_9LAMI|nr:hypothetical protein F511_35773 [Dorcoceras hygrometricum]